MTACHVQIFGAHDTRTTDTSSTLGSAAGDSESDWISLRGDWVAAGKQDTG